jgi:predicted acylesterase/phospholipase RssA
VISLLSQLEANNQYLLLVADSTDTAWTKLCISHADRILIVADPKEDPSPGVAEHYLSHIKISLTTDLVLWHPKMTLNPGETLAWLKARNVTAHHHVRKEDDSHMQRLARRMSGHAIGLVLSGGAARGFAHIGVQHALEELKIPVDTIGSSSMGGVVGGLMGFCSSEEILKKCEREFSNPKVLFDYTLPFTSVMASKNVTQMMHRLFGDRQIEDLWIPFFCTATNLSTAQLEIFQQGPLWRAVRSTLAIPGVFTPVMENGEILVDGGVLNNFPVQLTADFCKSEYIIGVHMGLQKEGRRDYDFDTSLSGWQVLFRRINPFSKPMHVPSLASLLMNTLEVNSLQSDLAQVSLTDLMISPNLKAFKSTDYGAFGPIAQIGYNAALEPLGEWKKNRLTFLNHRPSEAGSKSSQG